MKIKYSVDLSKLEELGFTKGRDYYNSKYGYCCVNIETRAILTKYEAARNYSPRTYKLPIPDEVFELIKRDWVELDA